MIRTGLISVTFRRLPTEEIVRLAAQAGLQGIEWGGDVHVPPGDVWRAKTVGNLTKEAGLEVVSYGSYYRVGGSGGESAQQTPFATQLETAIALQAPAVRVWAGDRGSSAADERFRARVADDGRRVADMAAEAGLSVDFEFHGDTLADTADSALRLLHDIGRPNVRCHWQPPLADTAERRLRGLRQMLPQLANLHVFHWSGTQRRPLKEGEEEWKRYLAAASSTGTPRYALLEFVKDDDPAQLLLDAETLKAMLR